MLGGRGAAVSDETQRDEGLVDSSTLTRRILVGLALGFVTGLVLNVGFADTAVFGFLVEGVLHVGGQIFLSSLKLLVVPLVLVSLACGTAALDDVTKLGRIGGKTLGLYLMTTAVAISLAYGFIYKMVEDVAGKDALPFFPYIMTLFLFIVMANFLGLIPMSFTTTSHIAVTAVLALAVFLTVTAVGFIKNGAAFLGLFWVSSAPMALRPILAIIELISYFVRPVSHSIRLAGNVMAGHAVIKVFAGFAGVLGLGAVAPIVAITAVYGLEVLVAFIQAYVFTILTCVYLRDALHPSH